MQTGCQGGPHILTPLASVCIGFATILHRVPMQKGSYPYANGMPGVSFPPLVFEPLNPLAPLTILAPFTPSSSLVAHFHRIRHRIVWSFGLPCLFLFLLTSAHPSYGHFLFNPLPNILAWRNARSDPPPRLAGHGVLDSPVLPVSAVLLPVLVFLSRFSWFWQFLYPS